MPGDEYNESPWREGSTTQRLTAPFPPRGLNYYSCHQAPLAQCHFLIGPVLNWIRFSRKKNHACLELIGVPKLLSASYLVTILCRKDEGDYFFPKLHVHIKDNNNSPHGKFRWFLFPFSNKFPDLNFALYVLYIYSCYMKPVCDTNSKPGLPVVPLCNYPH